MVIFGWFQSKGWKQNPTRSFSPPFFRCATHLGDCLVCPSQYMKLSANKKIHTNLEERNIFITIPPNVQQEAILHRKHHLCRAIARKTGPSEVKKRKTANIASGCNNVGCQRWNRFSKVAWQRSHFLSETSCPTKLNSRLTKMFSKVFAEASLWTKVEPGPHSPFDFHLTPQPRLNDQTYMLAE